MNAINIGSRRELFIDKLLIDTMEHSFLKLHEPVPMGTAIEIDKPWEGGANSGSIVIPAKGKYHMYYRCMHNDTNAFPEVNFGLAISEDGITWNKPVLQPEEGTNFVELFQGFYDECPDIPENEKYKAFRSEAVSGDVHTPNYDPAGAKRLVFYASPDGICFHKMDPQPQLISDLPNSFDGGCTMFWSHAEQQYVFYYRYSLRLHTDKNAPDITSHRSVARITSKDFYKWSKPERMYFSDPSEQIYVNNTAPYFRAPHIYLGAAARFMEQAAPLTEEQAKQLPFENDDVDNIWKACTNDCSDGVLLTTRAGTNAYDRTFMETFIRPGTHPSHWVTRSNYALTNIIPYDEETMFLYVNRCYLQRTWHVERLALRTDGFASLSAPWSGGIATTKPFIFSGKELEINYRTGAAGYIKIELLNQDGYVIPGFHGDLCHRIVGNEIKRIVRWRSDIYDDHALQTLAGTPIRMRFYLKDADVFSFKFNES